MAGGATIDSAPFEELTKNQRVLARQQLQVLAHYLKIYLNGGEKKLLKEKDNLAELKSQ